MFPLSSHTHIIFKAGRVHGGPSRFSSLTSALLPAEKSAFKGSWDYPGLTQTIQTEVPIFWSTVLRNRASCRSLPVAPGSKDDGRVILEIMQLLADFAPEHRQEGPGTRSHPRRPPWLAYLSSLLGAWCFLLPKEQNQGSGEEWETKQG